MARTPADYARDMTSGLSFAADVLILEADELERAVDVDDLPFLRELVATVRARRAHVDRALDRFDALIRSLAS